MQQLEVGSKRGLVLELVRKLANTPRFVLSSHHIYQNEMKLFSNNKSG